MDLQVSGPKRLRMRTKATLKNISQALNLSISTVSRALKNHPDISDHTKQKVMKLASLMEYEPNTYAINLRTNKSKIFGLMIPEISHYFYDSLIAAVEEEARQRGYSLLILQSGEDPAVELDNLRLCRLNRVAGVFVSISARTKDIGAFLKLDELDIPVVFFDKVPAYEACNKVCIADAEAASLAANKILQTNRRHVLALMGNPEMSITRKRKNAFINLLQSRNPAVVTEIAYVHSVTAAREKTIESLLKQDGRPDTIFCMSDEILAGAMKAIQQLQLRIPDDIAVIAISNDGFIPKLFVPEITYVETSGYQLGKLAFKRMNELLEGKSFIRELTLPSRLVMGNSI